MLISIYKQTVGGISGQVEILREQFGFAIIMQRIKI